ncbi:MAG: type IV pilus assembly protein PilM [Opitutae bacterium]|nr:type IV pilus assembly protein PilM [Opitutae bacterium]
MAKKPILTLDIGSHCLKLAEFADVKGGLEMTRYAISDLGVDPQSDADRSQYIITTIHDLIRESGCKPGPVQVSISGHSVFSRFVKLPPVEPEKVYQIIQYEAQQNVPFPMNEVVWDYQLISGNNGDVDVMLAAIKSDIVAGICDCVRFTGLEPNLVDVAPMALYNAVRYNYDNLPPCTLVVDIGARSTDLIFIEAGRIFSRSVPVAGNQITQLIMNEFGISFDDAEAMKKAHAYVAFGGAYEGPQSETVDKVSKSVRSMMTRLHQELNRSINFYRSQQGGQQPSLLLLTGGSSVIPYTDTFLREKLNVETDYFNPFNNVAVSEQIPAEQIGAHACEMGQMVGLALRQLHTCPIEVNLLPPKAEEEKKFKRKLPVFALAAAGALLTLIVWIAFYARMTGVTASVRARIETRVGELSAVEQQLVQAEAAVAAVEGKIAKLTALESHRGVWRNLLGEISGALADGIWLTRVNPLAVLPGGDPPAPGAPALAENAVAGIEIEGMGYLDKIKSSEAIGQFRDRLRESQLFSDKTEIIWQPPARPDASTLEFKILAVLEAPQEL